VALIKPQFEAGAELARRERGVIRDPEQRQSIIGEVLAETRAERLRAARLVRFAAARAQGQRRALRARAEARRDVGLGRRSAEPCRLGVPQVRRARAAD
jgi:hypothetical protein